MPDSLLIESESMELGEVAVIKVTNRQVLINYINGFINAHKIPLDGNILRISLDCSSDCGGVAYKTVEDIPYHSIPCPCGNPKHWLIKYDEE